MKAVVVLLAAIGFAQLGVQGQAYFDFNVRDPSAGIDVRFVMPDGSFASGPDLFVEVLAGTDADSLLPLTPLLALNRTGAAAGYSNPFAIVYGVPDWTGPAVVAYRAFQGSSWDQATIRSGLQFALAPVWPSWPPGLPPEVLLGTRQVVLAPAFPQGDRLDQWTWRGPPIPTALHGIAFGAGQFVAVGDARWPSAILTSPDGHNWLPQISPTTNVLNAVGYGNGLFVAVGQVGTILTSTNAVDWIPASSGVTNALTAVCYGQGLFVVAGENGQVLSSSDGTQWERRESNTTATASHTARGLS